jgi:hypothetical protein
MRCYHEALQQLQQRVAVWKHIITYTGWYLHIQHNKIRNIYLLELGIVINRMLSVEIVARVILTHLLFNGLPRWPLMPYYAVRSEEHISFNFSQHFKIVVVLR